jgi:tRNA nucleotidyltransferase/poly(A) polymerase
VKYYSEVMDILRKAEFDAYVVGGWTRDAAIGSPLTNDVDVVTNARPDEIAGLFEDAKHVVGRFAETTYVPLEDGSSVEISTMTREKTNGKGEIVTEYTDDLKLDLARRDATMNAIAISSDGLVDPFHGVDDINRRVIRAVGDPRERIVAHPIRLMRYVRFCAQYENMRIDDDLSDVMIDLATLILTESWEAIRAELMKGLALTEASTYISLLQAYGLLACILPEVDALRGQEQNKYHKMDAFEHTLDAVNQAKDLLVSPEIVLAVMLHDVGKPKTAVKRDGDYGYSFLRHEIIGAEIAQQVCERLKMDNKTTELITLAVRWHMYRIGTKRTAKRFLMRMNEGDFETVDFVLHVMWADRSSDRNIIHGALMSDYALGEKLVLDILADDEPFTLKDLDFDGHMVMDMLDIGPSQAVGDVLKFLLGAVVKNPELNNSQALQGIAREYYHSQYPAASSV